MAKLRYFKFYYFYKQAFQELNPFAAKKLLLGLIEYAEYGKIPQNLRGTAKKSFESFKEFIDSEELICKRNGYKGSKKRWKNHQKEE